ncbi:multidrug effflux MFS transporter [Vibrio rhizosphaerae]|uniref:Multidrug effflux MFS transporter n=1 Tax=Vibrio rhizosphaerae TaxID=398736 RepID=A0ABU4J1F6_9VIBR|nr:multidrug effflux MFS transporter [Vibrio rhizosphaerae]MDW6094414.1 multidrug effflux MFS transporter [Vibrio rhizosphaerae]
MHSAQSQQSHIKKLILIITILGQASIALYLPALPEISRGLVIDEFQTKLTVTCFIIGFGISPMFFGPISDRIGRKPILFTALLLALIGFVGNIFSATFEVFILCRILEGLGCGGLLTSGRSIVRDVFSGKELASASSYLSMGFALGFGLSPVIGGLLTKTFHWTSVFIFLALFDLFIMVLCFFYLPETKTATPDKQQDNLLKITLKDYLHAIANSQFMINVLGGFFAYCIVISYNVMTPFLVQENFNFSPDEYGYLAVLIGVPYYLAALMNRQMVLKHGIYFSCLLGSILILTAGAAMLFANLNGYQNIYVLMIPFMIATFGQALIFSNTIASALQLFPATSGGRMSALYSSLQMILVSLTATYFARLPDNNTIYLATVVLCMGGFCLILILLSEKIRQKQLAKAAVV